MTVVSEFWGDVDCVIQMGAPKGSSRLLQRIGRSNHRMDEPSKAILVPGNRFEYLEAQAALDAGVASLDASIGGIGGCPFAPAATGNIPTDDLLYMLDRSGVETGVSLERIIATSQWLVEQLGRGTPAMLPKAGIFPQIAEVNRTRLAS